MGKRNSVLTKEEKNNVVKLYLDGKNQSEIARKYGVYPNSIRGLLIRRGIELRKNHSPQRKYKIDQNFFDIIDSEEKAYTLGLFYADGSNNEKKGAANINLKDSDDDILIKLTELIQPEKPLGYYKRRHINHSDQCMFSISNRHISNVLAQHGCMQNKTHKITFPKWLDKNLYRHFIRGYFDGDGHIGIYYPKDRNKRKLGFSIVGTESFCNSLTEIFKEIDVDTNMYCRHPERHNNTRQLHVGKKDCIKKVMYWMYHDSTIYMERKFKKYNEVFNNREESKHGF